MAEKKKLTPDERREVERQIAALQESLEEQAEAETPAEQSAADDEVEEQKRKTAALFDKLNLTEEDFEILAAAFAAGTEDRTRRIVREELAAEEEAEGKEGSLKEAADDPGAAPVKPDAAPDNPAPSKHWTEKKIFGKKEDEEEGPRDD